MKKYLLLLTILIGSNYATLSQTTDTICAPVSQMKKVYAAAAQKKIVDSLLLIANSQVAELKSQISLLEERDIETRNNYQRQIDNLERQTALYIEQVKGFEKLLRRERTKRRLITGAGILTTTAALLMGLKK